MDYIKKIRTKEIFKEMRKILISGVALCLLYGGLRFVETLLFDGNPVIGFGALAGGAALSLIIFCVYITFPHPTFFPLFVGTLSMVTFITVSVYMQAIDFHYIVMLLGMAFIASLKKSKLPIIFAAINIGATIIVFIFAALGSLPWLEPFRFFTQFALFLYGSLFIIWQTRNIERSENETYNEKRANKEKTRFLADMSHEIRAPLTVIATGIDFADAKVKSGGDITQIRNALDIVREETQRLGRMVGSMVNLAAMSDTDENRKRMDFAALLINSAEVFRLSLEKQENRLNVEIADGLPDVYVEADRFAQVLTNLFTNTARHTKNGSVTLAAEYNETFITVRLSDTGEGIHPDILPRVFERGVSGENGTGYGLYLCKTIVEAHGGTITIDNERTGTTVTFTVPVYGGQEAGYKI